MVPALHHHNDASVPSNRTVDLISASARQESANKPLQRRTPPSTTTTTTTTPPTSKSLLPDNASHWDVVARVAQEAVAPGQKKAAADQAADLARGFTRQDLQQQWVRRWNVGDVYSPHDLSGIEMSKWKRTVRGSNKPRISKDKGYRDDMDQLGIDPRQHYKNFSMMSEYVTEMGRIRHSSDTGLRPVNQRRMAKAVRRAIGMGLIPSVYRHPELLKEKLPESVLKR
jgi:small subunit ribosomal protein S18